MTDGIITTAEEHCDETKSGNLLICAGSSARILQQLTTNSKCDRCTEQASEDVSVHNTLRHVLEKAGRERQEMQCALRSNTNTIDTARRQVNHRCNHCGRISHIRPTKFTELSKMVKVCVYTKGTRPYLVIYDSTTKYATPVMHQKLKKFKVTPHVFNSREVDSDQVDNLRFRVHPNMSDDVIIFQAITKEQRDEWAGFLARLTQKEISPESSPQRTKHHLMKTTLSTLEEAEEPIDDLQRGPLKAPTRRQKSREGRRSSLTSIGVRLLRRPLARPLA